MLEQLQPTPQNEQTYNINYATKKDPQQDYSGFGYALNNLFRGGALDNGLGGLLGYDNFTTNNGLFDNTTTNNSLYSNLFPFLADYFWGNQYRTNDTGNTMTPNFYFPLQNQTTNNQGVNNVNQM